MRFPARARTDLNVGRGRRGTAAAEVTRGASSPVAVAVAAKYTGGVANRTGWWEIRRVHVEGAYWLVDSP